MLVGWQSRHPFRLGAEIQPRAQQLHAITLTVTMRGEDAYGPWIAVNGDWQRLDARLYELASNPAIPLEQASA